VLDEKTHPQKTMTPWPSTTAYAGATETTHDLRMDASIPVTDSEAIATSGAQKMEHDDEDQTENTVYRLFHDDARSRNWF
jgi:hypothetical protein